MKSEHARSELSLNRKVHSLILHGCNCAALCRATRGQGVIISSGARSAFELRGPYDAMNLGMLMGLSEQQAKVGMWYLHDPCHMLSGPAPCAYMSLRCSSVLSTYAGGRLTTVSGCCAACRAAEGVQGHSHRARRFGWRACGRRSHGDRCGSAAGRKPAKILNMVLYIYA